MNASGFPRPEEHIVNQAGGSLMPLLRLSLTVVFCSSALRIACAISGCLTYTRKFYRNFVDILSTPQKTWRIGYFYIYYNKLFPNLDGDFGPIFGKTVKHFPKSA